MILTLIMSGLFHVPHFSLFLRNEVTIYIRLSWLLVHALVNENEPMYLVERILSKAG